MNTHQFTIVICLLLVTLSCDSSQKTTKEASSTGWTAVYQNDENGETIKGNINTLISGIRNGYDVRVGWGWESERGDSLLRIEHMAQPLFTLIIQEKNVSAVIDAHPLLATYIDIDNQTFREGGHMWQCVLTSKGTFNAKVYHRTTGELLNDWPQRHKMTWFLEYPTGTKSQSQPLY